MSGCRPDALPLGEQAIENLFDSLHGLILGPAFRLGPARAFIENRNLVHRDGLEPSLDGVRVRCAALTLAVHKGWARPEF